jgi:hypothetical protein
VAQVAEELLSESDAKAPSIERRLQRFVRNERIEVEQIWDRFLEQVLTYWEGKEVMLILDITPFEEYAQVVYVGRIVAAIARLALSVACDARSTGMGARIVGHRGRVV